MSGPLTMPTTAMASELMTSCMSLLGHKQPTGPAVTCIAPQNIGDTVLVPAYPRRNHSWQMAEAGHRYARFFNIRWSPTQLHVARLRSTGRPTILSKIKTTQFGETLMRTGRLGVWPATPEQAFVLANKGSSLDSAFELTRANDELLRVKRIPMEGLNPLILQGVINDSVHMPTSEDDIASWCLAAPLHLQAATQEQTKDRTLYMPNEDFIIITALAMVNPNYAQKIIDATNGPAMSVFNYGFEMKSDPLFARYYSNVVTTVDRFKNEGIRSMGVILYLFEKFNLAKTPRNFCKAMRHYKAVKATRFRYTCDFFETVNNLSPAFKQALLPFVQDIFPRALHTPLRLPGNRTALFTLFFRFFHATKAASLASQAAHQIV
ncbi:hypothetical protein KJ708_05960 [bacterium]|nr:hypothetical protein [bacterium]MBU1919102.1 hypothetical protein [bacterium]